MYLWWLDLFLCSFGGSKWNGRSNHISFNLLDHDYPLPLCTCIFTRYDQHKNAVSTLRKHGKRYNQSFVGKIRIILACLLFQRGNLWNSNEFHLHSHPFDSKIVWFHFGRAPNKQHHHLRCPWRRSPHYDRRALDAVSTPSLLL